jgi:hypothetical protein
MLQRRQTPSFCIIAPTAYCEEYASQSNTHLCLAHIAKYDEQYADFYRRMSDRGDYVICDNGAFELGHSYDPAYLVELGKKVGAKALVLPDYPGQSAQKTIDAANQYAAVFKDAGFDTFFVPQSEVGDLEDWVSSYVWGATNPEIDIIGISILNIPNALPNIPAAYARVVMTQLLIDRDLFNFDKFHHYLGLNAAPSVEIPALIKMNALDTCDSSNPVWCGINNIKYDTTRFDHMGLSKPYLRHVSFDEPLVRDCVFETIQHNVDVTLDIFKNPSAYL